MNYQIQTHLCNRYIFISLSPRFNEQHDDRNKIVNVLVYIMPMSYFAGQIIFLKFDRLMKLVWISLVCILMIIIYSKLLSNSTKTNSTYDENDLEINLSKYIHIDLKGAPPKADKFFESFFNFLEKIQLDVKGVVIEYEDILPLQGNLINVNI